MVNNSFRTISVYSFYDFYSLQDPHPPRKADRERGANCRQKPRNPSAGPFSNEATICFWLLCHQYILCVQSKMPHKLFILLETTSVHTCPCVYCTLRRKPIRALSTKPAFILKNISFTHTILRAMQFKMNII